MSKSNIEKLAGFVIGMVIIIGSVSVVITAALLLSEEWIAAGLSLIAAAISFSALLMMLFKN
jgi:hypothetical protein